MPRKWKGNGGEANRNCDGDLEKSGRKMENNDRLKDLETADRERSKRKVRGRKKTMEKANHGQLILDDSDAKTRIITTICNLTLV